MANWDIISIVIIIELQSIEGIIYGTYCKKEQEQPDWYAHNCGNLYYDSHNSDCCRDSEQGVNIPGSDNDFMCGLSGIWNLFAAADIASAGV